MHAFEMRALLCNIFFPPLVSEHKTEWYLLQHPDQENTFYCLLQVYKASIYTCMYVCLCLCVLLKHTLHLLVYTGP